MRTFLFDYDGTLCDTQPAITATVQAVFRHYQQTVPSLTHIHDLIGSGKTLLETLTHLLGVQHVYSREQLAEWVAQYRLLYRNHEHLVQLFIGAHDTLTALNAQARLVLLSNKSQRAVDDSLQHFGLRQFFDLVLTDVDGQACKPNPLVFEQRIAPIFSSLTPAYCVMVGDTVTDLQFAKNIGAASCFAAYGYGNHADCETVGYTHRLNCLADLVAIYRD